MEILGPGALFKVGNEEFAYEGTTPSKDDPSELQIVGRLNPEASELEGALYRSFSPSRMREAILVGPFGERLPYAAYLKEKAVWQGIFGPELDVPRPPRSLGDALKAAEEAGIKSFEPHYFPPFGLSEDNLTMDGKDFPYPESWKVLERLFWQHKDKLDSESFRLPGAWIVFDTTQKPVYDDGSQEYSNDPLAPIIEKATGWGSRFRHTAEELQAINKEIAKVLGVKDDQVRLMRVVENNTIGNLFHSELDQNLPERYGDRFKREKSKFLRGYGFGSNDNCITSIMQDDNVNSVGSTDLGFRPIVIFPQQQRGGIFGKR